ncbi:MAG: toxin-antitoxin system YwqK family antitoxin, partial [Candidatus Zixiibacteriota bacterium]
MSKLTLVILCCAIFSISVHAWDATVLDTVEIRYSSGQLKEQYQTLYWGGREETRKYGFYKSWHEDGKIEWYGNYAGDIGDIKVGCWIKWDSSGFLLEETSYDMGLKNGADIEWNPDGTYRKLIYYKNDTLHGLCTWAKRGMIVNEAFNNPNLALDSQMYYLNGRILVT